MDFLGKISENDVLNNLLVSVFEGGDRIIGKILFPYTSFLALVACLLMGLQIVSAIVASATSGKVLGDKYHQVWAPLRIVLGFGMLIPISSSYSTVHYAIHEVVRPLMVNLGNAPFNIAVEHVFKDGKSLTPHRRGSDTLVNDVIEHELCSAWGAAHLKAVGNFNNLYLLPPSKGQIQEFGVLSKKTHVWNYGDTCGMLKLPITSAQAPETNELRLKIIAEVINEVRPILSEKYVVPFYGKQWKSLFQNADGSKVSADVYAQYGDINKVGYWYGDFGRKLDKRIIASVESELTAKYPEARKRIIETAKQQGLLGLGEIMFSMSQNSALKAKLVSEQHENQPPLATESGIKEYADMLDVIRAQAGLSARYEPASANDYAAGADTTTGYITKILAPVYRDFFASFIVSDNSKIDTNAMTAIATTGANLKLAAGVIITSSIAIKFASGNFFMRNAGVESAVDAAMPWLNKIALGMYILGWIRSDLFPFIGYLFGVVVLSKIMLAYIQCFIGVPGYAYSHITLSGSDLFEQRQQVGFLKIVETILRPAIYVISMIMAQMIFDGLYFFLDSTLGRAYMNSTGGRVVTVDEIMTYMILSTIVLLIVLINLYGAIPNIIENTMEWFGQQFRPESGMGAEVLGVAMAAQGASKGISAGGAALDKVASAKPSSSKSPGSASAGGLGNKMNIPDKKSVE